MFITIGSNELTKTTNQLHNAFVLIRCTKASHKNCKPVRNALMNNFKNVLQSYTTNAVVEGTEYCVAGKALIKDSEINEFEKNLKKLKTNSSKPVGISELKVLVAN